MRKALVLGIVLVLVVVAEYVPNRFVIKFTEDVAPDYVNGIVHTSIARVDNLNIQHQVNNFELLYEPETALPEDDPYYTDGVNRIYIFYTRDSGNMESVAASYLGDYVEYCEADYLPNEVEERRMDLTTIRQPASPNFVPQDDEYHKQWYLHNAGFRPDYEFPPPYDPFFPLWFESERAYVAGVDINAEAAWDHEQGSAGWQVAICSDGLGDPDGYCTDLDPNRIIPGYNALNPGGGTTQSTVSDYGGYNGTFYSGIIGAKWTGSTPTRKINVVGVDRNCKIIPIKVWNTGPGNATTSILARGIYGALYRGADVILITTTYANGSDVLHQAVGDALKENSLCVAPAYNPLDYSSCYPAAYNEVLSVSGVTSKGRSILPDGVGYSYIDVVAPIDNIYNLVRAVNPVQRQSSLLGMSHNASSSAAITAGVAMVTRAAHPGMSATEIKSLLQSTCRDISPEGWDNRTGWGLLDMHAAVVGSNNIAKGTRQEKAPPVNLSVKTFPNPAHTQLSVELSSNLFPADYIFQINDLSGRLVRRLSCTQQGETTSINWDLCDEQGHKVATGIYNLTVIGNGKTINRRFIVAR